MPSIFTTLIKYIRDLPLRTTPLDTDMIPCAGVDGNTYRTTRGAIRQDIALPAGHAASHKHGGLDEVATATPAANAIPKANGSGKLDGWISGATTSSPGLVELATDGETSSGVAVQGNDGRLRTFRVLPTEGSEQVAHKLEVNDNQGLNLTWIQNLPTDNIAFINIATASESGVGVVQLAPDADNTPGLAVQADDSRLGNITPDTPQTLGAAYLDIGEVDISAVPNPAAGHRRLYLDDSTHQLTAKKSDGSIADLENQAGSVQVELTAGGASTAETLRPGAGIVTTDEGDLVTEISVLDATTSIKGIVELATNGESASGVVVQGNDERLLKPIRKATTTTISGSATLTPDPELTRSVVSGNTYYFRLVVHVDDAGSVGITYTLDGTATYSHIRYQTYALGNVSWSILNSDRVSTIGTTSQAVGDTSYCIYIDGSCVVTGSGTIEFNWAPSSVVIDDVSVREASTFELTLAQ